MDYARRAHEVFRAALDEAPGERVAFADRACGSDVALRAEVQALFEAGSRAGGFLETPALDVLCGESTDDDAHHPMLGRRIGQYTLTSVLASGGMGTVFLAQQDQPRRHVALKVLRGGLVSRATMRRFEFESQILARLQHPHIAQVLEAGMAPPRDGAESVPYFAMEHVTDAQSLTRYAGERHLDIPRRLALFLQVCDAVHFGHQRGVIHRDLKPANILVDGQGRVKVIDFGVARVIDPDGAAARTLRTSAGEIIGTLQYMSPEQCGDDPHGVDTRSDVYALGVTLYELLCGHTPYDLSRSAVFDAARIIRQQNPARLTRHDRTIPPDLETIVFKALEKDRSRRYQSVGDLARDIGRFLDHQPIEARPASAAYQLRLFARRNRGLVAGLTLAAALLVAGAAASTILALGQARARKDAETREREAQRQAAIAQETVGFLNDGLLAAADPFFTPNPDITVRAALDAASLRIEGRFADEPAVEAAVRATIGKTYVNLGRYEDAQPHLERALALRRAALGDGDPDTLASLQELGWLRYHQQRYADAEALMSDALSRRRTVLGADAPDTLVSLTMLASLRQRQGRNDEAERLFKQTLEARRRVLGENDPAVLESLDGLARVYMTQGRYGDAQPLYEQVLNAARARWGEENRFTLYAGGNFARLLIKLGRRDEALQLLAASLERARRMLGENHPDTLVYMGDLGSLLTTLGRLNDAAPLCEGALERSRAVNGEEHASTLRCMQNLAALRLRQRHSDDAQSLLEQAIAISKRVQGDEHPDTLAAMNDLGLTLDARGRREQAEALFRQALESRRRVLGERHPDTLTTLHNLAFCVGNQQRYDEAERMFRDVIDARKTALGPRHPDVALALTNLGYVVRQQGRADDAAAILREAIETWRASGASHVFFANALGHLATILRQQQRHDEAEPLLREALAVQQRLLPADDPAIAVAMGLLGDTLTALARYEEAEPLLLESHARLGAVSAAQQRRAAERLAGMYHAWAREDEAAKWRERATATTAPGQP